MDDFLHGHKKGFLIRKNIKYKILLVIIPFFLIIFLFLSLTIYFSSNNGITSIAKEFLGYKLQEVNSFFQGEFEQKVILDQNNIDVTFNIKQNTVEYTKKFTDEIFFIIPYDKINILTETYFSAESNWSQNDLNNVYDLLTEREKILEETPEKWSSWFEYTDQNNIHYVGIFIPNFNADAWFVLISKHEYFYKPVNNIIRYIIIIVLIGLIVMIILILFFVSFLTRPLNYSLATIKEITNTMDFSKRIKIFYPDEIGLLGEYFNQMIQELEKSYNYIKNYAYNTVLAKKREERIRFIFQKYVPSDVIEEVLENSTDTMLIGKKQMVTILFSDIREFTTISESLDPEKLVVSLNNYFTLMVRHIIEKNGIVDKFIGDAIMAIFGAPKKHSNDAEAAIYAAINMIESLRIFNDQQQKTNLVTFEIGIGINTGEAIVGNIGSDQKLDYTVMGDPVNLGARLEGLTKLYHMPILVSEFTKNAVSSDSDLLFFNVDIVRVKGKVHPVKIYYPFDKRKIPANELSFYKQFSNIQKDYLNGNFTTALRAFDLLEVESPFTHPLLTLYRDRCHYLIKNPPKNWDGVQTWTTKS
ncbi:MAG: adenylate/guanylate cyclase domain-containing protein [Brevinema sp.]